MFIIRNAGKASKLSRVLYDTAACRNTSASLFDYTDGPTVERALLVCARCEVTRECEEFVRPRKSFYDGVAGGKVWVEGRQVLGGDAWGQARID